jgi:hypothetical protein
MADRAPGEPDGVRSEDPSAWLPGTLVPSPSRFAHDLERSDDLRS